MNKTSLIKSLRDTQQRMIDMSNELFVEGYSKQGAEMFGACEIITTWVDGINGETTD